MVLEVILTWGERDRKWAMSSAKTGRFLYDFWDCDNFNRIFRHIDKTKENRYFLSVRRIPSVIEAATKEINQMSQGKGDHAN